MWIVTAHRFTKDRFNAGKIIPTWDVVKVFHDQDFARLWVTKHSRPVAEYDPTVECGPFLSLCEHKMESV